MLGFVLGTRPEIIKMAPIMRLLDEWKQSYYVAFTNQHTRNDMALDFFRELRLRGPDGVLNTRMDQRALNYLSHHLVRAGVSTVLVEGDTDSVLLGAQAAILAGLRVCHVEAGLRCGDITMAEEKNRIAVDHMAHYLCAPTQRAWDNLMRERVAGTISLTGNTIADALRLYDCYREPLLDTPYFLVTQHRRENVDDPKRLGLLVEALELLAETLNTQIVFPVHPRTQARLGTQWIGRRIQVFPPVGYSKFCRLLADASLVLTDSGGVQEEAAILGTPCVTLRTSTERQETVDAGVNVLANTPEEILDAAVKMQQTPHSAGNLYGDGHAAEKILEMLGVRP